MNGRAPPRPTKHGWLVLDKPLGLTSTQALGRARKLLGASKAGHGGTLDPLASGILPLAFGEATKLIPHIMDGTKGYEFAITWGEERSTGDAEGEVVATNPHIPNDNDIRACLPHFTGVIQQTPPAYSAIKVDGERAYDLARAGAVVELAARSVEIFALKYLGSSPPLAGGARGGGKPPSQFSGLLNAPPPNLPREGGGIEAAGKRKAAFFRVTCGKGMYVRSLAVDIARHLGTVGYVSELRRTQVGGFTLSDAVTLERLEELANTGEAESALLPISEAARDMAMLDLMPAEAEKLRRGQGVLIRPQYVHLMDCPTILATHHNVPVALVEAKAGEFHVVRGFSF